MIYELLKSQNNALQDTSEGDSEEVKPKKKKKPLKINESSVSDDALKEKENLFENEPYDIVIKKLNLCVHNLNYEYLIFFRLEKPSSILHTRCPTSLVFYGFWNFKNGPIFY